MRKGEKIQKMIFNKGKRRQIKVQLITRKRRPPRRLRTRTQTLAGPRLTLIGFICLYERKDREIKSRHTIKRDAFIQKCTGKIYYIDLKIISIFGIIFLRKLFEYCPQNFTISFDISFSWVIVFPGAYINGQEL